MEHFWIIEIWSKEWSWILCRLLKILTHNYWHSNKYKHLFIVADFCFYILLDYFIHWICLASIYWLLKRTTKVKNSGNSTHKIYVYKDLMFLWRHRHRNIESQQSVPSEEIYQCKNALRPTWTMKRKIFFLGDLVNFD